MTIEVKPIVDTPDPLRKLRAQVDLRPYTPAPNAPRWLSYLASVAANDLGALALLGPGGINVSLTSGGRVRAMPDPTALFVASLASRIRRTRHRIALGLPPAARHLPLLLASSAVLASTLDRHLDPSVEDGGVLVISPDLDARSRYCDLYVQSISLDAAHPGSRMRPTGERVRLHRIREGENGHGVCFFLPGLALPASADFNPDLVILDLRYARWTKRAAHLVNWSTRIGGNSGVLALYSVGDGDTLQVLTQTGFFDFPIDHAAIATCSKQVRKQMVPRSGLSIDWRLADAPSHLARKHMIVEISSADSIEETIAAIGRLLDEYSQRDNPDLNRARWLLAMFVQIPTPLVWYEQTARGLGRSTLRRLIAHLGTRSRHDPDLGAVIQTVRMEFEKLYEQMERKNPRAEALQELLPRIVHATPSDGQMLLLVRDRVVERAVQTWLELEAFLAADWLKRVEVQGCPTYSDIASRHYDVALINGALPRRYRWIVGAALGDRVTFLAYAHEADLIERQLQGVYGDAVQKARAHKREEALTHLVPGLIAPAGGDESPTSPLVLERPPRHGQGPATDTKTPKITVKDLASLRGAFATRSAKEEAPSQVPLTQWREDDGDENAPDDDVLDEKEQPHVDDVACVRVEVNSRANGHGFVWVPAYDIVECVRPSDPNDILRLVSTELKPGDVLLRMEEGGRASLFDRVVELAEAQPQMQYLAAFRRSWRRAIHNMVARHKEAYGGIDYGAMLRSLQSAGATIESELTIRFWIQDQVIGPEKVSSIVAVGRVSGSPEVVHQAKEFDRAFHRIRSIRQGIGRRLNGAIRRSFRHFAEGTPDQSAEQLDDRLRIPLDELLETIDLAEVISVGSHVEILPPHRVGRLQTSA